MQKEGDYIYLSTRKALFLMTNMVFESLKYSDKWLYKGPDYLIISREEFNDFYNRLDDKKRPFNRLLRRYLKNPGLLRSAETETRKTLDHAKIKLEGINLQEADKRQLEQLFRLYCDTYTFVIRFPNVLRKLDHAFLPFIDRKLKLSQHDITLLSYPLKPSEVTQEHIAIARASLKKDPEKQAVQLRKRFAQVHMGFHEESPKSVEQYIKEMAKIRPIAKRELRRIALENKQHLGLFRKVAKKVPKRYSSALNMFREMPFLKDYIKMRTQETVFMFMPLFEEISRRYGISKYDIHRLTKEEVIELIRHGDYDAKLVKKRKRLYVYMQQKKKTILYGREAERFIKEFFNVKQATKFTGRVACRGYAKGKVKVIRSSLDFRKFRKGDIIVANNTTPDFVPIIKRAAAIVAEEGGITAHVSVVSREFKVPCIVGISNATKIFKDNQLIEVDAINGVVRRA